MRPIFGREFLFTSGGGPCVIVVDFGRSSSRLKERFRKSAVGGRCCPRAFCFSGHALCKISSDPCLLSWSLLSNRAKRAAGF